MESVKILLNGDLEDFAKIKCRENNYAYGIMGDKGCMAGTDSSWLKTPLKLHESVGPRAGPFFLSPSS